LSLVAAIDQKLRKIRWRKELNQRGLERNSLSPELSEALRNEIRTVLEANGGSFNVNVARRVYDLSIAASDMCAAATDTEIDPDGVIRRYLTKDDQERNSMSPELSEALRREIRTALEADGGPFDINVARRVYDLAIAARDMCVAATGTVKEAIDQIKETNGPMETLDASDTPESQVQASESFGARLLRELMATLPMLRGPRGEDPEQLVHALAEARRNGMHDVAEQLEVKLFGRVLSGPRPISAEEVEVIEGSFEHGFADGRTGALPVSEAGEYHVGYLKGTTAKYLAQAPSNGDASVDTNGATP
jgi:Fe-S cluster biogenesis protein NfuA